MEACCLVVYFVCECLRDVGQSGTLVQIKYFNSLWETLMILKDHGWSLTDLNTCVSRVWVSGCSGQRSLGQNPDSLNDNEP